MIEVFLISECIQVDIVSETVQDSDWMEKNNAKIEMILHAKGFCTSDILSSELSEDLKRNSLFLYQGEVESVSKEFRGYVMSSGDYVDVSEIDEEPLEILKVSHYDNSVRYSVKFMVVTEVVEEEI